MSSSSLLHIGLVQLDIAWERPDENIRKVENLLGQSAGLDLVVLPEMWSTGFSMRPEVVAESSQGPALEWMKEQAGKNNYVITGSISVKEGDQFYNRLYFTFPDGRIEWYDKKHLFSFGQEDLHYTPGNKKLLIDIKGWKIMPVICYDLRFPVWCRNTEMYDIMVVVANWPVPRIHHWDTLLRARAIENQSYVAAVNRIGQDGSGLKYNGHSALIDMNGQYLLAPGEKEGISHQILDLQVLQSYRDQFRFLQDKDEFSL
jgi:omega-amidase